MISKTKIERLYSDTAPLYSRGAHQPEPDRAYLTLDTDGQLDVWFGEANNNAVPVDHYLDRVLTWRLPCTVTGEQLEDIVTSEPVRTLLERVHVGHTVDWDGSNRRGQLTADARDAKEDLDAQCRIIEGQLNVSTVSDYLGHCTLADVWPDGQTLAQAAQMIREHAQADGIDVPHGSVEDFLTTLRWDKFLQHMNRI